ncbi:MAG: ABC transporter permease [Candidatus Sericytochromatia bacterium]|nr:ABC transporter permease [Candidatus Tanganyikabacteria bacterium]
MVLEHIRQAMAQMAASRARTALTVLAIAIGVLSVVLLVSLGQSALVSLTRGIEAIGGTRIVIVWPDAPQVAAMKQASYTDGLTLADARALRARLPRVASVAPVAGGGEDSEAVHAGGGRMARLDIAGVDEAYISGHALKVQEGRDLTAGDLDRREHVCILGRLAADRLFPDGRAVGREVRVADTRYRVVGTLAMALKAGMRFGTDWNEVVLLPLTVASPEGRLRMISVTTTASRHNPEVVALANSLLLHRHRQVDDFQFLDLGTMIAGYYKAYDAMILVVGLLAGVSLVIGGVGITNMMLVGVVERTREIGLRIALGAPAGTIRQQFLIEALVLACVGGLAGLGAGVGIVSLLASIVPRFQPEWTVVLSWPAVGAAVFATLATGVAFGWMPARRAAALDPVAALRGDAA